MSVNATRFAWECDLSKTTKRSAKRLVLLALADRANKENTCFPSIARVVKDTGMDRKTVMNTINDLITLGLVSDTGERKGGTNQVRVLKINVDKQESYPQNVQESSNKQGEISKETVVNLPINGVEFPSNGGKFGTQNLKESLIKSKINLKSEKALKINENEVKSEVDVLCYQKAVNTQNTVKECVYNAHTSDSSDVKSVGGTYIPVSEENAVSRDYDVSSVTVKPQKTLDDKPVVQQMTNKGMQKAFSEYGEKREEVKKGVPDALKHLLKKKGNDESNKPDLTPINEEDVVNNTIVEQCDINDITESNIDHFDINQNASLATILSKETLETVSIFKRPPNVDIANKRMYYQEHVLNFKEDW